MVESRDPLDDGAVTLILGSDSRSGPVGTLAVANAQRASKPGWRDPRLWLGVLLIAVSVVAGARLLSTADDTTAVWAVERDLRAGETLVSDDLTARQVRFVAGADADRYVLVGEGVPSGARVTRAIGAGELVPRSALGVSLETGVIEVPITVEPGQLPPSVGAGSIVNIWVSADALASGDPSTQAVIVLEEVVVIEAPGAVDAFGSSGERQLVIGVPADQASELPAALGAAASGRVVITRQG